MKRFLCLGLVAVSALTTFAGCGKKEEKNNDDIKGNDEPIVEEKNNTNEGVVGDKEMNGLKFTNSSLTFTDNNSTLITTVTNTTEEDVYVRIFNIHVKDKDGNLIISLLGYVGVVIPAGQSRDIDSNVDMSLENAYTIEYEIVND